MTFADTLSDDMDEVLSADQFGETVYYYPKYGGGSKRTFTAVVEDVETHQEAGDGVLVEVRTIKLHARNHATSGIDAPNLGDKLIRASDLPTPAGQEDRKYFLRKVVDRDSAGGTYEFLSRHKIETGRNAAKQDNFS